VPEVDAVLVHQDISHHLCAVVVDRLNGPQKGCQTIQGVGTFGNLRSEKSGENERNTNDEKFFLKKNGNTK
jgi:hypothetical protein